MLRSPLLMAALLVGCLLLGTGSANAQKSTGTISGRIYYTNQPNATCVQADTYIVPASVPQPVAAEAYQHYFAHNACDGHFSVAGLASGDYLIAVYANPDLLPSGFDEEVVFASPLSVGMKAKRLTLGAGEQVTIDIPLTVPPEWLTPAPTPSCASGSTASISGTVTLTGQPPYAGYATTISWLPADAPQPINPNLYLSSQVDASDAGAFLIRCLAAGEYFLLLGRDTEFEQPLPDRVQLQIGSDVFYEQARRVRVGDGDAVTGIDFTIVFPTPSLAVDYFPTPTPRTGLPIAGTGSGELSPNGLALGLAAVLGLALVGVGAAVLHKRSRS